MNRYKKQNTIGIIVTIIILILFVIISNLKTSRWSHITNPFISFADGIQNSIVYLKNKIKGNDSFFIEVEKVKKENEELKNENNKLQQSLREFEILKAENQSLKEYVNLKDKYSELVTVPADVIQKDITNYSKFITINAGKNDGIDINMPVIADKGLVGYVVSVTDKTSKIQTIIDTSSMTTGTISTTRDGIVVKGIIDSEKSVKATYIPTDTTILEGDMVETSGIGGIYPKGIHIGTIKQVVNTKNITDRYAIIETGVDFSKLETVLVITNR